MLCYLILKHNALNHDLVCLFYYIQIKKAIAILQVMNKDSSKRVSIRSIVAFNPSPLRFSWIKLYVILTSFSFYSAIVHIS